MLVVALQILLAMAPTAATTALQLPAAIASARDASGPRPASAAPEVGAPIPDAAEPLTAPAADRGAASGSPPSPEIAAPLETESLAHSPMPGPPSESDPALEPLYSGLIATGAAFGGLGLVFKSLATSIAVEAAKQADIEEGSQSESDGGNFPKFQGTVSNLVSIPLLVTSALLLSSGLGVYGRWDALNDSYRQRPRRRIRTGLLIGGGSLALALGVVSIVTAIEIRHENETHARATGLRELGYWGTTVGIIGGGGLLAYGVGYGATRLRLRARITPMLSFQLVGVGLSGGF